MGSTGSIGRNVLAVAESARDRLRVFALAGARNMALLAEQANRWRPPYLACIDAGYASALRAMLAYAPQIFTGQEGYAALASLPEIDCVVSAQVGASGLACTLAAALAGKVIVLANKESLVIAGCLLRKICSETGAAILPVDSEHYAIFQCLAGRQWQEVKRLVLTASGGPFLGKSAAQTAMASPQDALKHPNWSMGAKITIDSATLMNKGLEFIEAMQLYGVRPEQVHILVHPQSIVHSLVEFQNDSLLAQMAVPDMRLPIAGCLLWPEVPQSFVKPLDLAAIGRLDFFNPDFEAFPCLHLAIRVIQQAPDEQWGKLGLNPACIALNAANEAAVQMFLEEKCRFGQIAPLIADALNKLVFKACPPAPDVPETMEPAKHAVALTNLVREIDTDAREMVKDSVLSNVP